jgi:glycosyltransferase A (GT-A) superfamily protein (DUF2064 family)
VVFSPDDAGRWFDARVPASLALQPQAPLESGNALSDFLNGELEEGATRVVALTPCTPALDPSVVVSAFLCLEAREVVLGPSSDGGVYLAGWRSGVLPVFDGIDWQGRHVLSAMIDRLSDTGLSLAVLPPCYKIETAADWRVLSGHLRALRRAGVCPQLPRIEALMERTVVRRR